MTFTALILSIMISLVPLGAHKHHHESEAQAKARYTTLAAAIALEAGENKELGWYLVTVARFESTFTRDVHSGKVRGDANRSWGPWQMMCSRYPSASVPGTPYKAGQIVGTDVASTMRATHAAAIHLRSHMKVCNGSAMCVFKRYGGVGNKKVGPKTQARLDIRVKTFKRLNR